jgi:hypothetical protein
MRKQDKLTAEDALNKELQNARRWATAKEWDAVKQAITARNILGEDLDHFTPPPMVYELDEDVRDRLMAHTRQDAAHALMNTINLLEEVRRMRRRYNHIQIAFMIVCFGIVLLGLEVWWYAGR